MNATAMLKEMTQWPIDERIKFVNRAIDEVIDEGWDPSVSPELARELERRLKTAEEKPDDVYSWDQVVERVRNLKK